MSVQWTPAGCPDEAAGLLGAWAMDACSEAEAEAVMDHISRCQACAQEAVRLRRAAQAILINARCKIYFISHKF